MRKNAFTYLLSIFFMALLFGKDVVMAFPSFFIDESSIATLHNDWTDEESERNRGSEESVRNNSTEYLYGDHAFTLEAPVTLLSKGKRLPLNTSYKQTFYGSVLTPPPDRA